MERTIERISTKVGTGWLETPCLRCGGETLIDGICMKCDADLNRFAVRELRRYASEQEIKEWCVMHYIDYEEEKER